MLERNFDLVRKIVWSYAKKHPGLEFDDLLSEACISVLEAEKEQKYASHDSTKGKETTFVWQVVNSKMKTIVKETAIRNQKFSCVEEVIMAEMEGSPEEKIIAKEQWEEFMSHLSPNAQIVCSLILNESDIYLPTDKPKLCRGAIMRVLKERGWVWADIWATFKEIKMAVNI